MKTTKSDKPPRVTSLATTLPVQIMAKPEIKIPVQLAGATPPSEDQFREDVIFTADAQRLARPARWSPLNEF